MRKAALALILVVALAGCSGDDGTSPEPCVPTDEENYGIDLEDLQGKSYNLEGDLCRSMVLLEFSATWCPACRGMVPQMQEWHDRYDGRGLRVLAVDTREDPELVRQFYAEKETTYRVLLDLNGAHTHFWDVSAFPTFVLLARNGEEILRRAGGDADNIAAIEAAIEARLPQSMFDLPR